jgi:hypothetical protein
MAIQDTRHPIQLILGVLFQGVRWPKCKAEHSPPSSAKVKNVWSFTSTPQCFMEWCLGTGEVYLYLQSYFNSYIQSSTKFHSFLCLNLFYFISTLSGCMGILQEEFHAFSGLVYGWREVISMCTGQYSRK